MTTMINKMKPVVSKIQMIVVILAIALMVGGMGSSVSEASPNIQFNCTHVDVQNGVIRLHGVLYNAGDQGASVTEAHIKALIRTDGGRILYNNEASFYNVGIYLAPGDSRTHSFNIMDGRVHGYDGMIHTDLDYMFQYNCT